METRRELYASWLGRFCFGTTARPRAADPVWTVFVCLWSMKEYRGNELVRWWPRHRMSRKVIYVSGRMCRCDT